ncbi:MAG TPA: bifunctional diguanylate cyclase/phosphodiesterase [Micromonosporaceae bacterium]
MTVRERFGHRVVSRTRASSRVLFPVHGSALPWLTGAVIAAGLAAVALMPVLVDADFDGMQPWLVPADLVMVAAASAAVVRVRVRAAVAGTSWTDSAILICIVSLPAGWVGPDVLAGVLIGKLLGGVRPYKALYNASKDALSACAGLLVAIQFGLSGAANALSQPVAVVLVAVSITAAEMAVGLPVLSLVSRTPWYRVHRADADIKAAFFAGKLLVTVLVLLFFPNDPRLLALVPAAVLCLHLLVTGRVRARSDRVALQRLATTTEKLDASDIDTVLASAAADAVSLFSAEEAEVYLRDGPNGPRLARGSAHGVVWSGDPSLAAPPTRAALVVSAPMTGDDGPLGEVRLHFAAGLGLSDRELLTLRTFTSAVRTAARNASALAVADEMARTSADALRHDPLTGLANRTGLQDMGERLLAADAPVTLVTIGIDRVRDVNGSLGHGAGDQVLVAVATRLSTVAAPGDIVGRLHGDVFAVLLGDAGTLREARDRAAALIASLSSPIEVDGVRVRVEATAGIADRPAGPVGAEQGRVAMAELLRRADVAMWQAKRGGPRVVRYEPDRDPADVDALILGGELPRAIEEREFTVSFQPIVDLATGAMVAAEALARWRHPVRGELDPRRFLDAVERSGLLPSFEEAVLDQALAAHARWVAAGIHAPVAVNAGPRSLADPEYPRLVRRMLAQHGASGADLVVELTESLSIDDLALAETVLAQLREAGVRLALDDFGTRSSPMAMVTRIPGVDLKVDRSFVAAMDRSPESLAVVRSTVELGRSLGRLVVAEGVERDDQRRALRAMGCRAGQGHLFARALPIDDLMRVLAPGRDGVAGRVAEPLA